MDNITIEQEYLKAKNRVEKIKGFYSQIIISPFLITFWVYINLKEVPEFQWFWIATILWSLGLFIHWLVVFGLKNYSLRENWKKNKVKEIMLDNIDVNYNYDESNYIQEMMYTQSKKRVKQIKSFYMLLGVFIISLPIVIYINLAFTPGFHYFWYVVYGMILTVFFHWIAVFGISKIGFGAKWEQRKIKQLIDLKK